MNKKIPIIALFFVSLMFLQTTHATTQTAEYAYLTEITDTRFLPSTIYAGNDISLAVDIKNRGITYSIVDLNGVLDVGKQFEPISLNDSAALIQADSIKTLVFRFKAKEDTLPGYYAIFLTMTYLRNGTPVKETQNIVVPVSKTEKNIDVTLSPKIINPGNQTQLTFSLKNVGGTAVSNISFYWEETNNLILPLGSDNKRFVPEIQPDQTTEISYTIAADPNITPGIYSLNITLAFTDVNGTKTQTSQVGLIIGGKTDFEVSAEILSSGQLSLSIANIGSNNAGAVVAKIPLQPGISVSGSSIAILGNLNKGDFTLANFQVQSSFGNNDLNNGPAGNQANAFRQRTTQQTVDFNNARTMQRGLLLEIDYTDTTGERQSIQKTIQLNQNASSVQSSTFSSQQTGTLSWLSWALLAAIICAGIAWNKFKGKKSWKNLAIVLAIVIVLFLAVIFLLNSNLLASVASAIVSAVLLAWFFCRNSIKKFVQKTGIHRKQ